MKSSKDKVNLLFIMTDQQRFDTLSCHGGVAHTPNVDSLASIGVDLKQHYSQAPVCMPSRSCIFSGRYLHSHHIWENNAYYAPHEVHLFKVLRQKGYWMAYHGKNHVLEDLQLKENFDESSDPETMPNTHESRAAFRQLEIEAQKRLDSIGSYASTTYHNFPDEVTHTGMTGIETAKSLKNAPADSPWCIFASFSDPHVPHLAPERFEKLHPIEKMVIPPLPEGDIFEGKPSRVEIKQRAQGSGRATDEDKKKYLSVYYSMCSFIDEQIGNLLETLKQRPDADRTVIIFTSDHGDFAWHHGMCKKDLLLYEDLLHVPAIVAWPGTIAPQVVDATYTQHVDLVPTILDLMSIPAPFGCQGTSFAPLLKGETDHHRDITYAEICNPWMINKYEDYDSFMKGWENDQKNGGPLKGKAPYNVPGDYSKGCRTFEWSYNWYGSGFEELYDLKNDPEEWYNLAGKSEFSDPLNMMRKQLSDWYMLSTDPRNPETEKAQLAEYSAWKHRSK